MIDVERPWPYEGDPSEPDENNPEPGENYVAMREDFTEAVGRHGIGMYHHRAIRAFCEASLEHSPGDPDLHSRVLARSLRVAADALDPGVPGGFERWNDEDLYLPEEELS